MIGPISPSIRRAGLAALLGATLLPSTTSAQRGMPLPQTSPAASVTQVIGVTEATVSYHRPAVRGRQIWNGLLPYGSIWRAGANENTTVSFSTPVSIEGNPVAAGTYGLHMIPTAETWTVIFSNNSSLWGSGGYNQAEDALRVEVTPEELPFQEYMSFDFALVDADTARLELRWETLRVPLTIDVDIEQTVVIATDEFLRTATPEDARVWARAAQWCLERGVGLETALAWSEEAVAREKNFSNLGLQAQILDQLGRAADAAPLKQEAWTVATEDELIQMGGELMAARAYEDAVLIFQLNARSHPESWKAHDQLADAYNKSGDVQAAMASYDKALELVTNDDARRRIERARNKLNDA